MTTRTFKIVSDSSQSLYDWSLIFGTYMRYVSMFEPEIRNKSEKI